MSSLSLADRTNETEFPTSRKLSDLIVGVAWRDLKAERGLRHPIVSEAGARVGVAAGLFSD